MGKAEEGAIASMECKQEQEQEQEIIELVGQRRANAYNSIHARGLTCADAEDLQVPELDCHGVRRQVQVHGRFSSNIVGIEPFGDVHGRAVEVASNLIRQQSGA